MRLLDATVANLFQFVTMPLEVIGLTMAYLEFRHPRVARKANQTYQKVLAWNQRSFPFSPGVLADAWRNGYPKGSARESIADAVDHGRSGVMYSRMLLLVLGAMFVGAAAGFVNSRLQNLGMASLPGSFLIMAGWIGLLIAPHYLIQAAAGFIPGRPLGGIGILIASIGVLGEIYQLAVIMQDSEEKPAVYILLAATILLIASAWRGLYRMVRKS